MPAGLSDRVSALVFSNNKKKKTKKKKNASRNTHIPRKKQNKQKHQKQTAARGRGSLYSSPLLLPELLLLACFWELGKKQKKNTHNQRISASDKQFPKFL
jgi:hypothetical protein